MWIKLFSIGRASGTSASAPVFSAMVTLWNDMRITYGQAPMGFIAPFLYQIWADHPEAFNDVVTGNNASHYGVYIITNHIQACCSGHVIGDLHCCSEYFAATPGWDAVSGLGSPNFGVIANLVINPDTAFPSISAYPAGSGSSSDNNDNSKDIAIAALAIACFGFIVAAFGLWKSISK